MGGEVRDASEKNSMSFETPADLSPFQGLLKSPA